MNLTDIKNKTDELKNLKADSVGGIINNTLPFIFVIAGFILLLYLVWGGFAWMTSGGDPKAIEGAKSKITNALIGFVILFAAYWIVQILGGILGIRAFSDVGF